MVQVGSPRNCGPPPDRISSSSCSSCSSCSSSASHPQSEEEEAQEEPDDEEEKQDSLHRTIRPHLYVCVADSPSTPPAAQRRRAFWVAVTVNSLDGAVLAAGGVQVSPPASCSADSTAGAEDTADAGTEDRAGAGTVSARGRQDGVRADTGKR